MRQRARVLGAARQLLQGLFGARGILNSPCGLLLTWTQAGVSLLRVHCAMPWLSRNLTQRAGLAQCGTSVHRIGSYGTAWVRRLRVCSAFIGEEHTLLIWKKVAFVTLSLCAGDKTRSRARGSGSVSRRTDCTERFCAVARSTDPCSATNAGGGYGPRGTGAGGAVTSASSLCYC
ncbi:hypothetical protein EVAR_100956_1 [Eumeta japonica]|uniref:Uncharacterized protein n=1 Tax=Eumeta variegata TaxID=151549 RepID=A0A4C2A8I2_EUMVA|nr:hypothetical protein EVAR_100956_1 [Eumeta japonica]